MNKPKRTNTEERPASSSLTLNMHNASLRPAKIEPVVNSTTEFVNAAYSLPLSLIRYDVNDRVSLPISLFQIINPYVTGSMSLEDLKLLAESEKPDAVISRWIAQYVGSGQSLKRSLSGTVDEGGPEEEIIKRAIQSSIERSIRPLIEKSIQVSNSIFEGTDVPVSVSLADMSQLASFIREVFVRVSKAESIDNALSSVSNAMARLRLLPFISSLIVIHNKGEINSSAPRSLAYYAFLKNMTHTDFSELGIDMAFGPSGVSYNMSDSRAIQTMFNRSSFEEFHDFIVAVVAPILTGGLIDEAVDADSNFSDILSYMRSDPNYSMMIATSVSDQNSSEDTDFYMDLWKTLVSYFLFTDITRGAQSQITNSLASEITQNFPTRSSSIKSTMTGANIAFLCYEAYISAAKVMLSIYYNTASVVVFSEDGSGRSDLMQALTAINVPNIDAKHIFPLRRTRPIKFVKKLVMSIAKSLSTSLEEASLSADSMPGVKYTSAAVFPLISASLPEMLSVPDFESKLIPDYILNGVGDASIRLVDITNSSEVKFLASCGTSSKGNRLIDSVNAVALNSPNVRLYSKSWFLHVDDVRMTTFHSVPTIFDPRYVTLWFLSQHDDMGENDFMTAMADRGVIDIIYAPSIESLLNTVGLYDLENEELTEMLAAKNLSFPGRFVIPGSNSPMFYNFAGDSLVHFARNSAQAVMVSSDRYIPTDKLSVITVRLGQETNISPTFTMATPVLEEFLKGIDKSPGGEFKSSRSDGAGNAGSKTRGPRTDDDEEAGGDSASSKGAKDDSDGSAAGADGAGNGDGGSGDA